MVFFLIFLLGIIGFAASINKTLSKNILIEFDIPNYSEVIIKTSFLG
jgi:hypothetical protein